MLSAIARFDAAATPSRKPSERRLDSTGNHSKNGTENNGNSTETPNFNLLVLELHRLLHCMERDGGAGNINSNNNHNDEDSSSRSAKISWQALSMRMELLQSLWQQVQHAYLEAQQQRNGSNAGYGYHHHHHHHHYDQEEPPIWYREYEQRVYRASQKAQEAIHAVQRQEAALQQQHQEEDNKTISLNGNLIDQIFFPPEERKQEEQEQEEAEIPVEHDLIGEPMPAEPMEVAEDGIDKDTTRQNSGRQPAASRNAANNNNVDIQAFQKDQREQIEQAIALMASQMKQETERIHSTLKGQTNELLGEMEDLAANNVEQVTQVTQDVNTHVSDGWKRSFGTITLLIMVASLFLFSLVTIYMIPKYNSPSSAVPPQKLCRMVNGKEECLDLNAWLTGGGSASKDAPSAATRNQEEEVSAPYFTTLDEDNAPEQPPSKKGTIKEKPIQREELVDDQVRDDDYLDHPPQAQNCEIGMDGRCIPMDDKGKNTAEDHHASEEIHDHQRKLKEMLEREKKLAAAAAPADGGANQKKTEIDKNEELSEDVLAMLALDLEADGLNVEDLSEDELAMLKLELEAQGSLDEDREQKLARGREWRQQQEEGSNEEGQGHSSGDHLGGDHLHREKPILDNGGAESEFDLAQRKEQLLREREQRENLHNIRQMQAQASGGRDGVNQMLEEQMLEERERMRLEREEQFKRRDEFRERELQQLEEQRRQRELEQQQRLQKEGEERQQQEQELQKQTQSAQDDESSFDLPPPPPSDSFMEQAKGFGAFRDEQVPYRQKRQAAAGGGGAAAGPGFGAVGGTDPFAEQKAAAPKEEGSLNKEDQPAPEPDFRGKPFAPRDIRRAAASGQNEELIDYLEQRPNWVNKLDKNNWGAIHLAVRAGHLGAVEILLNANAEINGRTAQGLTALGMAEQRLGEEHPITDLLRRHGGEL